MLDATPTKKVDYPFTLTVTNTNFETNVEVRPSVSQLHSKTTLDVEFWEAGTNAYTKKSYNMAKGSGVYTYTYDSGAIGVYKIIVTYHYSYQRTEGEDNNDAEYEEVHTAEWFINRSYLPEYNAFESFDSAKIYDFMRGNGSIYIKEIPNLEHNKGEITTSMVSYRIPLLLAAIVLFLADIVIRKIRFKDKRFKKMEKEKEEKRKAQKGGEA